MIPKPGPVVLGREQERSRRLLERDRLLITTPSRRPQNQDIWRLRLRGVCRRSDCPKLRVTDAYGGSLNVTVSRGREVTLTFCHCGVFSNRTVSLSLSLLTISA